MHTNVILTNKRRTHAQSNYTNTELKAWFRRLLRHLGPILQPQTHAGKLTLWDHGHGASALRSMPVYVRASAGTRHKHQLVPDTSPLHEILMILDIIVTDTKHKKMHPN